VAFPAADEAPLPEYEPLTPELLEDEAIRGDFVLRWAVVGLALLLGCSQISDARVLVHARTGQYLAAHGFWPPANDPFSITAADRRWINLHWLFDLFVGAIDRAGPMALSLVQGLLAAVTFGILVHTVRPGIRTWWGSICGVLALLAVYPHLELRPELITLLGLATVLWVLIASERPGETRRLWLLPGVMWLWAQCDPWAWVGGGLIGLTFVGRLFDRRSEPGSTPVASAAPLLTAVAVMLVHPFLWETWLSPWRQFAIDYPALQQSYPRPSPDDLWWYPLWSEAVWLRPNHRLLAALFLAAAAGMALNLNRRRAPAAHWCWFLGANLLGLLAVHELAAAALVNCVLATVHGQEWFKDRFGQVYSVARLEVLFSRGGRAVTVLGLFLLAVLTVSGRIDGPDGRRTGLGLDRDLANDLDSYRRLQSQAFDDRGFHFTLRQGDAMIAAGRKSFVDHRVGLFAGEGDADLLARHRLVRRLLRRSQVPPLIQAERQAAQQMLTEYGVSHALPRLNSTLSEPDYTTFLDLLTNPDWMLTDLLPTTAVFHRTRTPTTEERQFVAAHELNVIQQAFLEVAPLAFEPRDPARPPTLTQRVFSRSRLALPAGTLEASHWLRLAESARSAPLPFRLSCCTLAVRAARQGVQATPDLAEAHRLLAESYQLLGRLEAEVVANAPTVGLTPLRYFEAIAAARQAAVLEPGEPRNFALLVNLWQTAGKVDCTYAALTRLLELLPLTEASTDADRQQREALETMQVDLAGTMAEVEIQSDAALAGQQDRLQVAAMCHQSGCVERAVSLLKADPLLLERNPLARHVFTLWLAELGNTEELIASAERLEFLGTQLQGTPWHDPVAYAALSRSDYANAVALWLSALSTMRTNQIQSVLMTAPMTTSSPVWLGIIPFPIAHLSAVQESCERQAFQAAQTAFHIAACEIERGAVTDAATAIRQCLAYSPDGPLRPLCRAYLYCLTGELLDREPPHDQIPVTSELFAPDP
jgi:tetratricopeptide (TPR) repeat protein